jgi:hypothetical protein
VANKTTDDFTKASTAVKAYLDALSELDMINMKATVQMFTKEELQDIVEHPECTEAKKAFINVAMFLKGIQEVQNATK